MIECLQEVKERREITHKYRRIITSETEKTPTALKSLKFLNVINFSFQKVLANKK